MVAQLEESLMTKADVAAAYRIHPKTVEQFEKNGKIPRRLERWPGQDPRWLKSEVVAHMRSLRQAAAQEQRT